MLHFQFPDYLILLALAPAAVFLYLHVIRWKRKTRKKIGDPELVQMMAADYSPKKFGVKFGLTTIALMLCILGVAGLVLPDSTQRITRSGTDMMIALDVSKSMLATDVKPDRLERAKQLISKVIDGMPDERVGLVVFAGRAYLQMPLTIDHQAAKMFVSSITTDDIPTQGTVISDALRMSLAVFNPKNKVFKSVLLISDGEDHNRDAIAAARELAKEGVMVNTIGIGTPAGSPIPDPETGMYKKDMEGNTVISRLNEEELKEIARQTHGIYQLYTDPDVLVKNLKEQLSRIEESDMQSDSSYLSLKQYYVYFLLAAFVLLIVELLVSEKRKKTFAAALSLLFIFSPGLQAQTVNHSIREGNKFFGQQQYDAAEKEYQKVIDRSKENDIADFNMANVQFRKDNLDEAIKFYDLAIQNAKNSEIKQHAYYNRGVAYQKSKKNAESILSYKNALMLNPNDEEARQNLQRLLIEQQQNTADNKQQNLPDNPKKNKQNQSDSPQPKLSSISRKDAEEKLKALANKEQELQNKIHKVKGTSSSNIPEKDW